jgi:hypothetical protein
MLRALLLLAAVPALHAACTCQMSFNACNEAASVSTVFIGTVESIEPNFLNRWNLEQRADLLKLNEEWAHVRAKPSADGIVKLKESYTRIFPNLPADRKRKLESARTTRDLASLFYGVVGDGKLVRFRVRTPFKHETEDAAGDDDELEHIDIWTPFGECGYDFQPGETYLVYADEDEETEALASSVCTRTRRLSDAGEDLAYLYFLKEDPEKSARLEGFATTNELYQQDADRLRDPEQVKAPVADIMIALESPAGRRYAKTNAAGRYVFDGLAPGDYTLAAFTADYPREIKMLSAPKPVHVEAKSCNLQMQLIPK